MNKNRITLLCGLLLGLPLLATAQDKLKEDPAYLRIDEAFDLKIAKPEVNVNLPHFLLMNAVSEFDGGSEDPFAAAGINLPDVLKGIKLIRVVIIGTTDENRKAVETGVAALRKDLSSKWIPVVTIPDEGIGVYAMGDASGGQMAGLAVLISDGDDVIAANVVGDVPLGKVLKIATRINGPHGDMIKKALREFTAGTSETRESTQASTPSQKTSN